MAAPAPVGAENPAPAHDAAVTAADFRRTGVQGAKCVHLGAAFLVSSPQGKTKSLFASVAYSLDSLAARFAFSRASLRFARFILLEELVSGKFSLACVVQHAVHRLHRRFSGQGPPRHSDLSVGWGSGPACCNTRWRRCWAPHFGMSSARQHQ